MVSMELLYSLGCFLLYEGFRRAAIRMIGKDKSGRSSMFVVWIGIATTIVASLGLSTLWFVTTNPEESEQRIAIGLIFVSILIKSFAEPMFISEVHQKRLGTKPVVEGVSQILRSCSLCAMVRKNVNRISYMNSYQKKFILNTGTPSELELCDRVRFCTNRSLHILVCRNDLLYRSRENDVDIQIDIRYSEDFRGEQGPDISDSSQCWTENASGKR